MKKLSFKLKLLFVTILCSVSLFTSVFAMEVDYYIDDAVLTLEDGNRHEKKVISGVRLMLSSGNQCKKYTIAIQVFNGENDSLVQKVLAPQERKMIYLDAEYITTDELNSGFKFESNNSNDYIIFFAKWFDNDYLFDNNLVASLLKSNYATLSDRMIYTWQSDLLVTRWKLEFNPSTMQASTRYE